MPHQHDADDALRQWKRLSLIVSTALVLLCTIAVVGSIAGGRVEGRTGATNSQPSATFTRWYEMPTPKPGDIIPVAPNSWTSGEALMIVKMTQEDTKGWFRTTYEADGFRLRRTSRSREADTVWYFTKGEREFIVEIGIETGPTTLVLLRR